VSGYLDEAIRLVCLVDTMAMTRGEAEAEFARYLTAKGLDITLPGVRSILDNPTAPDDGPGKTVAGGGGLIVVVVTA
jgi:hypothetical protein